MEEDKNASGSDQTDDAGQSGCIRHRCGGEVCDVFADLISYIEDFEEPDEWQKMMPFVRLN